tara:strand:- start:70 stop:621 length:552 start_codon:yes stop_codon:yes gene_type:complete
MKRFVSKIIFWFMGWKVVDCLPYPKKCVVIAAPHTSNWDFLIGRCYGYIIGIDAKYLIKSSFFVPVIGSLFKWNGGIPVFRDSKNNVVSQLVDRFNSTDSLILGIAPEGTRSRVKKWKTGFYYIAHQAKVPILLLAVDFKNKKIGVVDSINPSGDLDKDMIFIQEKFKYFQGKIPENYNPIIR